MTVIAVRDGDGCSGRFQIPMLYFNLRPTAAARATATCAQVDPVT